MPKKKKTETTIMTEPEPETETTIAPPSEIKAKLAEILSEAPVMVGREHRDYHRFIEKLRELTQ